MAVTVTCNIYYLLQLVRCESMFCLKKCWYINWKHAKEVSNIPEPSYAVQEDAYSNTDKGNYFDV